MRFALRMKPLFQSTPPVAGGRMGRDHLAWAKNPSFNPRPPLLGGECADGICKGTGTVVSIHAPRCWGANACSTSLAAWPKCFNPRPPLLGGECLQCAITPSRWLRFQSTPPVAGGRMLDRLCANLITAVSIHAPRCWGANDLLPGHMYPARFVSIHAPRCWGANDALIDALAVATAVSIHAPRCWGANECRYVMQFFARLFQSTPPVAGGRMCRCVISFATAGSFNPRPPLLGGEWVNSMRRAVPSWKFQSTPPVAGGRMPSHQDSAGAGRVSIHAPRCWGANDHEPEQSRSQHPFQSTPPVAGGRMPRGACWRPAD